MEKKVSIGRKKVYKILAGAILLIGVIIVGDIKFLIDWSTNELITYNAQTLFFIFISFLLIYSGFKKSKK